MRTLQSFLLYPYIWQSLASSLFTLILVWLLVKVLNIKEPRNRAWLFSLPLVVPLLIPYRGANGRFFWGPLMPILSHLKMHAFSSQARLLLIICFLPLFGVLVSFTLSYLGYRRLIRRGQEVTSKEEPELFALLAPIVSKAEFRFPRIHILPPQRGTEVFAYGIFRPRLMVSSIVQTALSPEELQAVLAHEVAHLVRRDQIVSLITILLRSLMFYNPALYFLTNWLVREREKAADALATVWTGKPSVLAHGLLNVAKLALDTRPGLVSSTLPAGLTSGGVLSERMHLLLSGPDRRSRDSAFQLVLFGLLFAAALTAFFTFVLIPVFWNAPCIMVRLF